MSKIRSCYVCSGGRAIPSKPLQNNYMESTDLKLKKVKHESNKEVGVFETEKLPPSNGEKILNALRVALQKLEILEAIPEVCSRILARDINLERILGEETFLSLVHLALLRQNWENSAINVNEKGREDERDEMRLWGRGNLPEYIATSINSISPLTRKSNKSNDLISLTSLANANSGQGIPPCSSKSKESKVVKYFPSESGINKREKGRVCYDMGSSSAGNRNNLQEQQGSEEFKRNVIAREDGNVLEGGKTRKKRKKKSGIKKEEAKAIALVRNDSSKVTFLRDVINACVTNVQTTNKHSHVDSLGKDGNNSAEERVGAGEEGKDLGDLSHSTSTPTNNMMQLIRQALNSKYGDHTRRSIKDKDAKALLCILSLIDPHHCFTVRETANPIKGTKSIDTQTRQSNSNSKPPEGTHQLQPKSNSQTQTRTSIAQRRTREYLYQQQEQEQDNPSSLLVKNYPQDLTYDIENETKILYSPDPASPSTTPTAMTKVRDEQFDQENRNKAGTDLTDAEEIRARKSLLKKFSSESMERVLETIEELESPEQDYSPFKQSRTQSPDKSTQYSPLNDDMNFENSEKFYMDEQPEAQDLENSTVPEKCRERRSEDEFSQSGTMKQIVKIPLLEELPISSNGSNNSTQNSSFRPNNSSVAEAEHEDHYADGGVKQEILKTRRRSSNAMEKYYAQLDKLADPNDSETNAIDKSISSSITISFMGRDNMSSTPSDEPKWSKEVDVGFMSTESQRTRMQELLRKVFNELLFNLPALEYIKKISRENEEKTAAETNGVAYPSICNLESATISNGENGSLKSSGGLRELRMLMMELEQLMKSKLLTNFDEDRRQTEYLRHLWIKEKRNLQKIEKLKEEFAILSSNSSPTSNLLDVEIEKLQDDLNDLPKKSLGGVSMEVMEGLKDDLIMRKIHDKKLEDTKERMLSAQQAYESLSKAHFSNECKFRDKQHDMEEQLESIIFKYDFEIDSRQQLLDSLAIDEEHLLEKIQKLDTEFKDVDDRYLDMRAAKRLKEIMKGIEVANSFKKTWAAKRIQEAWRKYKIMKLKKKKRKGLKKKSSKANLKKGSATTAPETAKKEDAGKPKSSDSVTSHERSRSRSQSVVSNAKPGKTAPANNKNSTPLKSK